MKLSEAIRSGCEKSPVKLIGEYVSGDFQESCALGAAYLGLGVEVNDPDTELICETLKDNFPELYEDIKISKEDFPTIGLLEDYTKGFKGNLMGIIVEINDDWGYSREEIADWLQSRGY